MYTKIVSIAKRILLIIFICFIGFSLKTTPIKAVDYYVAASGNDSGSGTINSPWKSIYKAVTTAAENDTIHIKSGNYEQGGSKISVSKSINIIGDGKDNTIINNGGFVLQKAITLRNIGFQNSPGYILELTPPSGGSVSGLNIENCSFVKVGGILRAENYSGTIAAVRVVNNIARDISGSGRTSVIRIASGTSLTNRPNNITISNNIMDNIYSKSASADVIVVYLGEDSGAMNRYDFQPTNVNILKNSIGNIKGGRITSGSYSPGGRGVLVYGTNIVLDGNYIHDNKEDPPTAWARNCIYIKGSNNTIANNVVHNCASGSQGSGSGDITIKGDFSTGNKVTGNHITSDSTQTLGGFGIFTKGEVNIENNFIKKSNGNSGAGIWAYESIGKAINVKNNYVEVGGDGVHIWGADTGTVSGNVFISIAKSPTIIASGFSVTNNLTCKGGTCNLQPPVKMCINSGNYCVNSCSGSEVAGLNSSCNTGKCCTQFSVSTSSPSSANADINRDGVVNMVDIGIAIDNYARSPFPYKNADVNADGRVDIVDIGLIIDAYSFR